MGRPQEDSSSHQTGQPQEFDLQPQEYQYEPTLESTHTHQDDFSSQTYETSSYYDSSQQQQQEYQPQQANQGYGAQPAQPTQFQPQSTQSNPTYANGPDRPAPYPPPGPQTFPSQPVQFPPQTQNQPAAYPPPSLQTISAQPVQFPPPSPQTNLMYSGGPNKPVAYPPQGPKNFPGQPTSGTYPPQPQAVPFPPKSPAEGYGMPPKPAAQGIPVQVNQFQQHQPVVYDQNWQTELFDCMDDPNNALITACFPCVTFGQIAEIIDNGQTTCGTNGMLYGMIAFCIAMPCIISCGYRTKLRAKYGLVEAPAPDWLTHCLFEWCALCQEYRELQRRGLDPAIGWQGNLARQQPQVGMVPPMNQRMTA